MWQTEYESMTGGIDNALDKAQSSTLMDADVPDIRAARLKTRSTDYSACLEFLDVGEEGCGVLMLARQERRLSLEERKVSSCCCSGLASIIVTKALRSRSTRCASRSARVLRMNAASYTSPWPRGPISRAQCSTCAATASVTAPSCTYARVAQYQTFR
jgi:hypothetical protein